MCLLPTFKGNFWCHFQARKYVFEAEDNKSMRWNKKRRPLSLINCRNEDGPPSPHRIRIKAKAVASTHGLASSFWRLDIIQVSDFTYLAVPYPRTSWRVWTCNLNRVLPLVSLHNTLKFTIQNHAQYFKHFFLHFALVRVTARKLLPSKGNGKERMIHPYSLAALLISWHFPHLLLYDPSLKLTLQEEPNKGWIPALYASTSSWNMTEYDLSALFYLNICTWFMDMSVI